MDWRPVAVAAVVVLAGCGALAGAVSDDPGRSEATSTLTPVPVPEVTATPVPLPPGVNESGVRDADALLDAHQSALQGRSYTLRVRLRVNEDLYTRLVRVETPTRYYQHDVIGGTRGNVTQFASGPSVYTRSAFLGVVRYDRLNNAYPPESRTVRLSRLLLQVGDAVVFETTVDGRPAFVVRGTYPVHPETERLRNVSIRAVVEPSGLIRSLTVSYVRAGSRGPANVTRSFSYRDVDSTTVERPAWVDREFNDTAG
jgi:hypothetical protein